MTIIAHTLGFPRIGSHRELKQALEKYWNGIITQNELLTIGRMLRIRHWEQQKKSGIDLMPVGDFAWYDHVLTTSLMLNNIPKRHKSTQKNINLLDTLFKVSRGYSINGTTVKPSEMKKWFNTNYHYIVPEFVENQVFTLNWTQLFDEIDEALSLKYPIKPILLGPISYLWLGKTTEKQFNRLSLLPSLISTYKKILKVLSEKKVDWVQIDEPILTLELPEKWLQSYITTYSQLNGIIKLLLTTYFGSISHQLNTIKQLPVDGLHIDLISGSDNIENIHKKLPSHWILSAGVVNGRNIWKTNLYYWFKQLTPLLKKRTLWIASSCSLLHVPIDINLETKLNKHIKTSLAFAQQKCSEIKILCNSLNNHNNTAYINPIKQYYLPNNPTPHSITTQYDPNIINNLNHIPTTRDAPHKIRSELQHKRFKLPLYPTTTIGSFPQTQEIRTLRLHFKTGKININEYEDNIKKYIKKIITEQEKLDLDVLVHGEPERNDMVEYFGEHLDGFIFTQNGWVQSYGSRCVKPPIIVGDIIRKNPITTKWINYAQSLTKKPVKGILTGPITIMSWSFLREDIHRNDIALQLALVIRDEVIDLEKSGIGIIQIDEPALREGLPLKISEQKEYLKWTSNLFRITTSSVQNNTQIHTHICYSEFNDIISALTTLDVDVISIEASRSDTKLLEGIHTLINTLNQIGPGIYDIHSPNKPTINNFILKIRQLLQYIPDNKLWINPDCGLKTRSWSEIKESLYNMITAVKILRIESSSTINSNKIDFHTKQTNNN